MHGFWERQAAALPLTSFDGQGELSGSQEIVLRHCGQPSGLRILELGCGSGTLSLELARRGAQVTAVDFAESWVDYARQLQGARVEFICANALELNLGRRFDRIVGTFFLHEVPASPFPALLDVMEGHLAKDGEMIFVENSFFNPMFRLIRGQLVDRGWLRKVGSMDETPFDRQRFGMLRARFPKAERRVDKFVLFSKAFTQFLGHKRLIGRIAPLGRRLDAPFNRLPTGSRLLLAWSYHQTILARR